MGHIIHWGIREKLIGFQWRHTKEGDQLEEVIVDGTDKTVTITGNNAKCVFGSKNL